MAVIYLMGYVLALVLASTTAEEMRTAIAVLTSEDNRVNGIILFSQKGPGSNVTVTGNVTGLLQGEHGFHVHEKGDITQKCVAAGGHFNPEHKDHGAPNSSVRHVGDLGNINSTGTDPTTVNISDIIISLYGDHNIIGRSVVVHELADDLGLGNATDSKTTGHAGARLACGVIGIQSPLEPWNKGAGSSITQSATTAFMSVALVTLLKYVAM